MEPEVLEQVSQTVSDAVAGSLAPAVSQLGELAASGASAVSLDASQYDQLMTLGTSFLMSNVVICALAALACGILLGILLTQHWRP